MSITQERYDSIWNTNVWGSQRFFEELSHFRSDVANYQWIQGNYDLWAFNRMLANEYKFIAEQGGGFRFALLNLAPGPKGSTGRSGALNLAKRDLQIPRSQHPDIVARVPLTQGDGSRVLGPGGKPVMTREYHFTRPDSSEVIIQEHSAGHQFGEGGVGDQGAHFNVRPLENPRTGSVPGTSDHYQFDE
jgi:hypothetical protein